MQAGQERPAGGEGCADRGPSFMAALENELAGEGAAAQGPDRRLREEGSYHGRKRRQGEPDFRNVKRGARAVQWFLASAAALATGVTAVVAAEPYINPFLTKAQFAEAQAAIDNRFTETQAGINKRFDGVEGRVDRLEGVTSEILTASRETQELQLREGIQRIEDRLADLPRGSELAADYRSQLNEKWQHLSKVCAALGKQCQRRD